MPRKAKSPPAERAKKEEQAQQHDEDELFLYDKIPHLVRTCVKTLLFDIKSDGVMADFPNILLFGASAALVSLHLRSLLSRSRSDDRNKLSANGNVAYNSISIVYAMDGVHDDHTFMLIKDTAQTYHVSGKRRIIVLLNVHLIMKTALMALKKLLEQCSTTSVFLLSTSHSSCVDPAIISRCLSVNCNPIGGEAIKMFSELTGMTYDELSCKNITLDMLVTPLSLPAVTNDVVQHAIKMTHYENMLRTLRCATLTESTMKRAVTSFFAACTSAHKIMSPHTDGSIIQTRACFVKAFLRWLCEVDDVPDKVKIVSIELACDLDQQCVCIARGLIKQAPVHGISPNILPFKLFFWRLHNVLS